MAFDGAVSLEAHSNAPSWSAVRGFRLHFWKPARETDELNKHLQPLEIILEECPGRIEPSSQRIVHPYPTSKDASC